MSESLKFYLDEHIDKAVAGELKRRGIDVVTTPEIGMRGRSDIEHIERARNEGRVIVTKDRDYLRHHAEGVDHAGIAFFTRQAEIGPMVRSLAFLHEVYTDEEMVGKVEFL